MERAPRTFPGRLLLILILMALAPERGWSSGYMGGIPDAWDAVSIVVLGRQEMITPRDEVYRTGVATYRVKVEKAYKGAHAGDVIEFSDSHANGTGAVIRARGVKSLFFLQSAEDRLRRPAGLPTTVAGLSGLLAYPIPDGTEAELEAAMKIFQKFPGMSEDEQKALLLQELPKRNRYSGSFIQREILIRQLPEALGHFQQRLAKATDETEKLELINDGRILGDPSAKERLVACLNDPSFHNKSGVIQELLRLKDPEVAPLIRRYVNDDDEMLAVTARTTLFQLGEPDGKALLFEMIGRSKKPTVRYNAIHYLNWAYHGEFTDEEKAKLRELTHDTDPTIARVAGFIVEKWK